MEIPEQDIVSALLICYRNLILLFTLIDKTNSFLSLENADLYQSLRNLIVLVRAHMVLYIEQETQKVIKLWH
jgi:hypothetical protein